jgi:hypothetical protein
MENIDYRDVAIRTGKAISSCAELHTAQRPILTKKELAGLQPAEWIAPVMLHYGKHLNGLRWEWESTEPVVARGSINLLTLPEIYGDWKGLVYYDDPDEDPRLATFKPVDLYAPDSCVGLYHDERADPALYYYEFGEEPYALGIDVQAYFQLLSQTLGIMHWPLLLLEAAALPPDAPYQPQSGTTRDVAEELPKLYPAFDLADFIATYRQLRRAK